jgi:outer membrane protein, heavy metal efflux system
VAVADARAALAGLLPLGAPIPKLSEPVVESRALSDEAALVIRATSARAELRALRFAADRARGEMAVARGLRGPQPTITGGIKRADDSSARQRGGLFGLAVSIPLFDTGRRESARWDAEARRLDAERQAIEQRIRAEVTGAAAVLAARQELLAPELSQSSDDLLEMADIAYREGDINIVALLDALRTAARARTREIDVQLEARLAQAALERAVGGVLWP